MENTTITMPVDRLSYSSMTQLLRNPIIFKMKYILGIYDSKTGVSGMVGKACHEALKLYYSGNKNMPVSADPVLARGEAMQFGLEYLANQNDNYIEYGKTGTREQMLKTYTQAMNFYFSEEPEYNEILFCEEKMTTEAKTIYDEVLPLPITGSADLVHRTVNGDVEIIDTKFVKTFTDYDTEDYVKIVQGEFMFHLLKGATGIEAKRMIFREVKTSENKDGTPQVRDWAIPFNHEPYHIIFYNLFKDCVKYLSNDPVFLPNLSDMFDGEQAGLIYAQGLINADMSDVEVMHKVRDVAFTTKKFISSRLDNVINTNLLPEEKIKMRLAEFGIPVEPVEKQEGASVIQYRFKVSAGIPMSRFKKHKDDIARAIEAEGEVNIIAPIPGTSLVGVEVARSDRRAMKLSETHLVPGTLSIPIGSDIYGNNVTLPLNQMPHLLVAGATGSGKSYFLHTAIEALTKQMEPGELELILIDPKRVELKKFVGRPHVNRPLIFEYDDAVRTLLYLTDEMERRYKIFEKSKKDITNIDEYNKGKRTNKMSYIVTVIDEFGDFMMRSKMEEKKKKRTNISPKSMDKDSLISAIYSRGYTDFDENASKSTLLDIVNKLDEKNELKRDDADIEFLIIRLAQMARAVGIHLILATQRPSVDVITGIIKANFPTRIALTTSSMTDSKVILDQPGAEKLSGKGDLLLMSHLKTGITRLQGYYV